MFLASFVERGGDGRGGGGRGRTGIEVLDHNFVGMGGLKFVLVLSFDTSHVKKDLRSKKFVRPDTAVGRTHIWCLCIPTVDSSDPEAFYGYKRLNRQEGRGETERTVQQQSCSSQEDVTLAVVRSLPAYSISMVVDGCVINHGA